MKFTVKNELSELEYQVSKLNGEVKISDVPYVLKQLKKSLVVISPKGEHQINRVIDLGNNLYRVHLGLYTVDVNVKPQTLLNFEKTDSEKFVAAPISGVVTEINVEEGNLVEKGQTILMLSAMKMENEIKSKVKSKIIKIRCVLNEQVNVGDQLIELEPIEDD